MASGLSAKLQQIIDGYMTSKGYSKTRYHCYYRLICNDCLIYETIWFDMSSFRQKGHIYVSPVVGICLKDVEDIRKQFLGIKEKMISNTISFNVGYMSPLKNYYEFDYSISCDDSVIHQLLDSVLAISQQFNINLMSYDQVIEFMHECDRPIIGQNYILPILYYLIGRKDLGVKYIEKETSNGRLLLENRDMSELFIKNYLQLI